MRNRKTDLISRFTSAHVIAVLALFIALGGSALAVSKDSVTSKQIKNESVAGKDIRNGSLTGGDVKDGSLAGGDVVDGSLTGSDVDESTLQLDPVVNPLEGPAGGSLTGEFPNPSLAPGSVRSAEVADGTLAASDLTPESVGTAQIANNGVGSAEVAGSAVTSSEIATDAISASEVANGTLNGDDIGRESGSLTVDFGQISANDCNRVVLNLGVTDDLSDDLLAVTPGQDWPPRTSITPINSETPGRMGVIVCNVQPNFSENPLPTVLKWIAIDV